jgi:transcriptional regulator NrdR family protein
MKVIKRDGTIVEYNAEKIRTAIKKANNEVSKKQKATDEEIDEIIKCFWCIWRLKSGKWIKKISG